MRRHIYTVRMWRDAAAWASMPTRRPTESAADQHQHDGDERTHCEPDQPAGSPRAHAPTASVASMKMFGSHSIASWALVRRHQHAETLRGGRPEQSECI